MHRLTQLQASRGDGRPRTPAVRTRAAGCASIGIAVIAGLVLAHSAAAQTTTSLRRQMIVETGHTFSLAGNFLAARFARRSKDISRAADYYRRALNADPENSRLLERAFSLMVADGQFEEGTELAERLVERKSRNRLASLMIAIDALHNGNIDRASELLSGNPRQPLHRLTVGLIHAWALQASGKTDEALKRIDDLEGMDWFAVYKAYHSGLVAGLAGRDKAAVDFLQEAYNADDGAMRVVIAYVRALARMGDHDRARSTLAEFTGDRGTHPLLAQLTQQLEAGEKPALLIGDPTAGAAEVLYGLGTAISRDGAEEMSAIYLQLSLYLNPDADLPKIVLSGLFEKLEHYDRSIDILERIGGDSPLSRSARIQMALNYNALDNLEQAKAHLRQLIEEDPTDQTAIRTFGNVLRIRKEFDEAEKIYSKGIELIDKPVSGDWALYYYRGICYERTNRWELAEADFKKALDLYPEQPLVLNYLGYSWVDMSLNLNEALNMIERAVAQRPNDGYIVDSLGWAYFRLGRFEDATRELERAVLLRPNDPVMNDHLGDAYWRVGRHLEARFQWNHALDMEPEPADAEKIRNKLLNGLEPLKKDPKTADSGVDG